MSDASIPVHPSEAHFPPTRLSVVLLAADRSSPEGEKAFEQLCALYWAPLYAFLRRQGESPSAAQDYVQGFFERLTERNFLAQMDAERGRFRTFLRASLKNYVMNQCRSDRAERRGGSLVHVSLDELAGAEANLERFSERVTPDEIYDRGWAEGLVKQALRAVRQRFEEEGRGAEFEDLVGWLARPSAPGDYASLAIRRGVTENAIAAAVKRLRREYLDQLRTCVLPTLESPADVDAELKYLLEVLLAQPSVAGS